MNMIIKPPPPPGSNAPSASMEIDPALEFVRAVRWPVACLLGWICWLATLWYEPDDLAGFVLHYPGLLLASGSTAWLLLRKRASGKLWGRLAACGVALAVAVGWRQIDSYSVQNTDGDSTITKDHWRSGDIPRSASMVNFKEGSILSGPLASSGSLHGRWKATDLRKMNQISVWYWYGEKVSEGEWHLRSKN